MRHIHILPLALVFLVAAATAKPIACEWKAPNGNNYDFSSLHQKEGYKLKDAGSTMGMFDLLYITNVCETVSCNGQEVSLFEGLEILGEVTSNCDVVTTSPNPVYSYINESVPDIGVQWQYSGDLCTLPPSIIYDEKGNIITKPNISTEFRTSTFSIVCSEEQGNSFVVDSQDNCHLKFTMHSPTACIGATSSKYTSFKILLALVIVFGLYFGIGSTLNQRKYGITGVEALPHYAFWVDFPYMVNDGLKFTLLKTTSLIRAVQSQSETVSKSVTGSYNTI